MRLSGLTLMVSLIATAALAAEPYEGTWDTDLVQCLDPESQSRQILMARDMGGYEESCKFTKITKAGSKFTMPLACEFGDDRWRQTMIVEVQGLNSITITRNKRTTAMMRCPNLPENQRIERLTRLWISANASCRGGSGASSEAGCKERERIGWVLDGYDWCYGKKDQIGADMKWHKCTPQSIRMQNEEIEDAG